MIVFLKGWVMNIVTLVVFLVLLEILLPSGKLKKFVTLISGFILMLAVINPFIGFLKEGANLKDFYAFNSSLVDRGELQARGRLLKEKEMKQVTEVYRGKLVKQIEENVGELKGIKGVKAEVSINEDSKSSTYGEIKSIKLSLRKEENQEGTKAVAKIEKVEVSGPGNASSRPYEPDIGLKSEIKNRITRMLGVEPEKIAISLVK